MLLTFFAAALATVWLVFVLTAFCPLRDLRRRRELDECQDL